ncbi:MAG: phosphatidate cytidylyltransferase [Oscillospiraceae bacterium]|nr:phosphatidate cytidylyltransferase [Oscillospiraceae bacterium]
MQEILYGAGIVCLYFIVAASAAFALRHLTKVPDELFRKLLHFILLFSYIPFAFGFRIWWHSVLVTAALMLLIFPILALAERIPKFSAFVNERKDGEFKHSFLLAFSMLAVCNTVCWGLLGDQYLGIACMYAWGVGDAFAALVGKRFGKHKIKWKYADHKKSVEGSAAMFVTSAAAVACVLLAHHHLRILGYILLPIAGAGTATVVEMISREGYDTILCPAAAMLVMIPLMALLGGFA